MDKIFIIEVENYGAIYDGDPRKYIEKKAFLSYDQADQYAERHIRIKNSWHIVARIIALEIQKEEIKTEEDPHEL